jgi:ParB-like chromosome segregation protein Spo0J
MQECSSQKLRARLSTQGAVAVALATLRHCKTEGKEFWTRVAANDGLAKGTPEHTFVAHILPQGMRKIDRAAVRGLMDSIREVGIINPLRVRPARRFILGVEKDAWEATSGGHRLDAARQLGLETVPCIIVEDDDLHAELAMIDENLMRSELDAAQRAKQTARRKAIYVILYPETAKGAAQAAGMNEALGRGGKVCRDVPTFVADTVSSISKSERAVRLDAERGEKISEQALDRVAGTKLATGVYLDRLKKLEPAKQVAKVERDLARPKPAKLAAEPLNDFEAKEKQVGRLMDAWNAASKEAREEFLSRIDTPIFDRSEAS